MHKNNLFSQLSMEQLEKFLHEYDLLIAHLRTIDRKVVSDKEKFTKYADVISKERDIIKATIKVKQELEKREHELLALSLNFNQLREQDTLLHKELHNFEEHLDKIVHSKK